MGCTMVQCIKKMKNYKDKSSEKNIEDWFDLTGGGRYGRKNKNRKLEGSQTVQEFYYYLAQLLKNMIKVRKNESSDFYKTCNEIIEKDTIDLDKLFNKKVSSRSTFSKMKNNLKAACNTVNDLLESNLEIFKGILGNIEQKINEKKYDNELVEMTEQLFDVPYCNTKEMPRHVESKQICNVGFSVSSWIGMLKNSSNPQKIEKITSKEIETLNQKMEEIKEKIKSIKIQK